MILSEKSATFRDHASAPVRFAETRRLCFLLRAEPPVGVFGCVIASAALQMVNAAIAESAGAHRDFPLDRTAGRHLDMLGKQAGAGARYIPPARTGQLRGALSPTA